MKHMLRAQGFALPTILIASVIMLTVLLSAVTATRSVSVALNSQYFNQLAREASESGLAYADMCLKSTSYSPTWSDVYPLRPDMDCTGVSPNGVSKWITTSGNMRTTFSVDGPQVSAAGSLRFTSTGTVQLTLSSNPNQVWRTYTSTIAKNSRYNDAPQIAGGAGWKNAGHNGYMLAGSGVLYGWGDNAGAQIRDASSGTTITTPTTIAMPTGVSKAKKVYNSGQGASILCILGNNDQVYCRGIPGGGEIGLMPTASGWHRFGLPGSLTALDFAINGFGSDSACAVASNLQVYCAGENYHGTLGYGDNNYTIVPIASPQQFNLTAAGASLQASKVFLKDWMTCVIATDSRAYCAGYNNVGQLGRGTTGGNAQGVSATPAKVLVPGDPAVGDIKLTYHGPRNAIFYHTSPGENVFIAGDDATGTAADGTINGTVYSTPRDITGGGFAKVISVGEEGAARHSICVVGRGHTSPNSGIWCVGSNKYGQLGNGNCIDQASWPAMINLGGETVSTTMLGSVDYQMNSVMVITTAGNAWAWGDNTYGKLGTGAPLGICNSVPQKVQLPAGVKAVDLANGDEYTTFILGDNGSVYAVGRNNNGQLGDGTTTNRSVPVEVKVPRQETVY